MKDLPKGGAHVKSKLVDINPHLTCYLCKGYYIDATTISECLHSFCRSCIIKFLHENSYCPICEVIINKAKPNLKLDKTLQDIVYKLVPELFLNEMKRRQRFYQNHPDLAAKVTPEARGEDTERTIFNPRDTISLSIEYISDDSTPGAILIPQLIDKEAGVNNKNKDQLEDNDENSAIKRFLQCSGMCRVEVLKKFIRNKYNVDTILYHIDILYKRVPLPDHYTLIDIAYIYSWKRNEPMKFFFKITDINLVTDNFDYLITPQLKKQEICMKSSEKKSHKTKNNKEPIKCEKDDKKSEQKLEVGKLDAAPVENKDSSKPQQFTNITLDRSNNVEIITKIQKVSNKNGLQIGIKITKQAVKKPSQAKPEREKAKPSKPVIPKGESIESGPLREQSSPVPETEVDQEKSNFLKSIELTAKSATSPQKSESPTKNTSPIKREDAKSLTKNSSSATPKSPVKNGSPIKIDAPKSLAKNASPLRLETPKSLTIKRKNTSPIKNERSPKNPKKTQSAPKNVQNPDVVQILKNVNENMPNMSKIIDDQAEKPRSVGNNLQALLFDSYKINIPASLSVTVKNEKDDCTPSTIQKPVQNYIEILKIPDRPSTPSSSTGHNKLSILDKLGPSVEVNKIEVKEEPSVKNEPEEVKREVKDKEQNESAIVKQEDVKSAKGSKQVSILPKTSKESLIKLNPRTPQTFQKMFEEAIKKPEFTNKFQTIPAVKTKTPIAPKAGQQSSARRRISEIASKLISKTKLSQEKLESDAQSPEAPKVSEPPISVPQPPSAKKRKPCENGNPPLIDFNSYISSKAPPQTVTSLHSPTLGLNYTVSVTQNSNSPKSLLEGALRSPEPQTLLNIPRQYSLSPKTPGSPSHQPISPKISSTSPKVSSKIVTPPRSDSLALTPNQILEKYNIQNLAQLTANFNFPPNLCMNPSPNQLAAMHQALIYRHFEMQNHQNWLNMNPGPLMQYEKYLQSLSKS